MITFNEAKYLNPGLKMSLNLLDRTMGPITKNPNRWTGFVGVGFKWRNLVSKLMGFLGTRIPYTYSMTGDKVHQWEHYKGEHRLILHGPVHAVEMTIDPEDNPDPTKLFWYFRIERI